MLSVLSTTTRDTQSYIFSNQSMLQTSSKLWRGIKRVSENISRMATLTHGTLTTVVSLPHLIWMTSATSLRSGDRSRFLMNPSRMRKLNDFGASYLPQCANTLRKAAFPINTGLIACSIASCFTTYFRAQSYQIKSHLPKDYVVNFLTYLGLEYGDAKVITTFQRETENRSYIRGMQLPLTLDTIHFAKAISWKYIVSTASLHRLDYDSARINTMNTIAVWATGSMQITTISKTGTFPPITGLAPE